MADRQASMLAARIKRRRQSWSSYLKRERQRQYARDLKAAWAARHPERRQAEAAD